MSRLTEPDLPIASREGLPFLVEHWYLGSRTRRYMMVRRFREVLEHADLRPGLRVLDLGCGWAYGTHWARTAGCQVAGIDLGWDQLLWAQKSIAPGLNLMQANAKALPFPDASFDFLTMGYALRHVMELDATFAQYHRVLRPGGRVLILEVTKPSGAIGRFFFRLYFGRIYPALTQLFTRSRAAKDMMSYYWETMDACVPPENVLASMRAAGFAEVKRKQIFGLFSEYSAVKT